MVHKRNNSRLQANLYIPSTINSEMELLRTAIWADKKWAGFWQLLHQVILKSKNNLDYKSRLSSQIEINFHPKNLKGKDNG